MGFIHDIKKVLAVLPQKKQSLLFSATFSDEIKALAQRLLNNPAHIEVARRNATADTIAQKVHPVGREKKKELLTHLIHEGNWHQVLVFTRMKHGANRLTEYLNKQDITAMAIHGNKSQSARTKALADFKSGELQVLVATDIAARGIDIDQLPHVVNFELPNVPEDYVHRIGRTGRAGAQGEAISLVCMDEEGFLADIEKLIKRSIPREAIAGFEAPPGERPEPIQIGRRTLGAPSRGNGGGHGDRGRGGSNGHRTHDRPAAKHAPGAKPGGGRPAPAAKHAAPAAKSAQAHGAGAAAKPSHGAAKPSHGSAAKSSHGGSGANGHGRPGAPSRPGSKSHAPAKTASSAQRGGRGR
jgi:ATP-dependent RNA helicase RhlE